MTTKESKLMEVLWASLGGVSAVATLIVIAMAIQSIQMENALSVFIYYSCALGFAFIARYAIKQAGDYAIRNSDFWCDWNVSVYDANRKLIDSFELCSHTYSEAEQHAEEIIDERYPSAESFSFSQINR